MTIALPIQKVHAVEVFNWNEITVLGSQRAEETAWHVCSEVTVWARQ